MSHPQKILNLQGQPLTTLLPVQSFIQTANAGYQLQGDQVLITPIKHNQRSLSPIIRKEELTPTKKINIVVQEDPSAFQKSRFEATRQISFSPPRKHPILLKTQSFTTSSTQGQLNGNQIRTNVPPIPIGSKSYSLINNNQQINLNSNSSQQQQQQQFSNKNPSSQQQQQQQQFQINSKLEKFYQTLDSVALLGHEFDRLVVDLGKAQSEISAWEQKCNLIKTVAATPPPSVKSALYYQQLSSDLPMKVKEYASQVQVLTSNMQELTNEMSMYEQRIRELESLQLDKAQLEVSLGELVEENKAMEEALCSVQGQLAERDQENNDMNQRIKDTTARFQLVEKEVQKLQALVIERETQMKEQVEMVDKLSLKEGQVRLENENLRLENENLRLENESLRRENQGILQQNENLKQDIIQLQNQPQQNFQAEAELRQTVTQLQSQVEIIQQEEANYKNQVEALIKENEQLQALCQESKSIIDQLKAYRAQQEQAMSEQMDKIQNEWKLRLQEQRTEAENAQEATLQRLQEMMQENEKLKQGYDQLQGQYSEKMNQVTESLNQRIIQLQQDLEQTSLAEQELIKERNKAVEDVNELRRQAMRLQEYRSKYKNLKKELKELKLQFDEYRQAFLNEIKNKFDLKSSIFEQQIDQINMNVQDSDQERIVNKQMELNQYQQQQFLLKQGQQGKIYYVNNNNALQKDTNSLKLNKSNKNLINNKDQSLTSGYRTDLSFNQEEDQQNGSSNRVKTEGSIDQNQNLKQSNYSQQQQQQDQKVVYKYLPQQQQNSQVIVKQQFIQTIPQKQSGSMMSDKDLQILQQKYQAALQRINNQISQKN